MKLICLQSGHEGRTTGSTGASSFYGYIAGIIDGEGYIGIKLSKGKLSPRFESRVGVSNTNEKLINLLYNKFGGRKYKRKKRYNWKPEHTWELTNEKASRFLQKIYNYLFLKKEQARLSIELAKTIKEKRNKQQLDIETINRRMNLYLEIKEMNKKGVSNG